MLGHVARMAARTRCASIAPKRAFRGEAGIRSGSRMRHAASRFVQAATEAERRIVVAVDDTDVSERACDFAIRNIAKMGDVFHVLHVIPFQDTRTYYGAVEFAPKNVDRYPKVGKSKLRTGGSKSCISSNADCLPFRINDIVPCVCFALVITNGFELRIYPPKRNAAENLLLRYADKFKTAGLSCECDLVEENSWETIAEVICNTTEALDATCLLIASHGKNPVQELLLGSVSNYCTHHCKKPVLIIH